MNFGPYWTQTSSSTNSLILNPHIFSSHILLSPNPIFHSQYIQSHILSSSNYDLLLMKSCNLTSCCHPHIFIIADLTSPFLADIACSTTSIKSSSHVCI